MFLQHIRSLVPAAVYKGPQNSNKMLFCASNTSTNVRHWYERPLRDPQTVNGAKRRRAPPLTAAQATTRTHRRMGGGVLKADVCKDTQVTGVLYNDWRGGAFVCPSFVNKAWETFYPFSYLSRLLFSQSSIFKNKQKHRPTASGLSAFIHSVINGRQTRQPADSQRRLWVHSDTKPL